MKAYVEPIKTVQSATLAELIALHEKGELVGVFEISNDDYHNAPGISKSGLDDVELSPAIFRYNRENPPAATDEMELGSALHTAILEPSEFNKRYAVAPLEVNRRGTKLWEAFEQTHAGKTIIKHETGEKIKAMAVSVWGHSRAKHLISGHKELSFFWKDPDTGLVCKCRVDFLPGKGVAGDYKSTRNAMPKRKWARDVFEYRYHVQGAWYLDGIWHALSQSGVRLPLVPTAPDTFVLCAQEKDAPYLIKAWIIGQASIALGRRAYKDNLKTILECERTGVWPGYSEPLETVECPEYAWTNEGVDNE